jgi:hypothetical protein
MKNAKTKKKIFPNKTIKDPLEYIRKHHDGIIDFDASMLLTFGFYNLQDRSQSSMPYREELIVPKTY